MLPSELNRTGNCCTVVFIELKTLSVNISDDAIQLDITDNSITNIVYCIYCSVFICTVLFSKTSNSRLTFPFDLIVFNLRV